MQRLKALEIFECLISTERCFQCWTINTKAKHAFVISEAKEPTEGRLLRLLEVVTYAVGPNQLVLIQVFPPLLNVFRKERKSTFFPKEFFLFKNLKKEDDEKKKKIKTNKVSW